MSQVAISDRLEALYVGLEASYGTTPSMTRAFGIGGTIEVQGLAQEELPDETQSVYLFDEKAPVHGLQSAGSSFKLSHYLVPSLSQLDASTVPTVTPLGLMMRGLWGNDDGGSSSNPSYAPVMSAAAGSLVATGTSATSIIVTSTQGTRFKPGQWILVEIGTPGSGTLEPTRIKTVATDTLTFSLALSGTPGTGAKVIACETWSPAQAHNTSMAWEYALASDPAHQWLLNACTGQLELAFERGKLGKFSVSGKAAKWTGPSAQSFSTAAGATVQGAPFKIRDATFLLQSIATTTKTHYPVRSFALKNGITTEMYPDYGGIEGTGGLIRTGPRNVVEATIRVNSDVARWTDWSSQTLLQCVMMIPQGAGLTKRWLIVDLPTCVIVGAPKSLSEGGTRVTEITLHGLLDAATADRSTDLSRANVRVAIG